MGKARKPSPSTIFFEPEKLQQLVEEIPLVDGKKLKQIGSGVVTTKLQKAVEEFPFPTAFADNGADKSRNRAGRTGFSA